MIMFKGLDPAILGAFQHHISPSVLTASPQVTAAEWRISGVISVFPPVASRLLILAAAALGAKFGGLQRAGGVRRCDEYGKAYTDLKDKAKCVGMQPCE